MCEIFTFPDTAFHDNKAEILATIEASIYENPHGFTVCTPTLTLQTVQRSSESMRKYAERCVQLLRNLTVDQRVWIHTRYATTAFIGVTECHGFSDVNDSRATRYMHNGVLHGELYNSWGLRVDSFELSQYASDARVNGKTLREHLLGIGESFANIFSIDEGSWKVTRMSGGTLYQNVPESPDKICYSSRPLDFIDCAIPVRHNTERAYFL